MEAWLAARPTLAARLACSPLRQWLKEYLAQLVAQRYATVTVRHRAGYLLNFGEFVESHGGLDIAQICQWVEPFLTSPPSARHRPSLARTALRGFIRHLRQTGAIPSLELDRPPDPHAELVDSYCVSLRTLRALQESTIQCIRRTCRQFLAFLDDAGQVSLQSLQAEVIHRFLITRGQSCCRNTLKTQCTQLRGFLAYLHRSGAVALDLCGAVVAPRVYQHDQCPRFLTRSQVDAVLATINRETSVGQRDYAIILLLSVYGLRGIEVVRLRLDDIDWRSKRLHIRRRKCGNNTTYPLAVSVDNALFVYLRNGRPASSRREVFLSAYAPFGPLCRASALNRRIAGYLRQVGVSVARPGTHLFRYSCAQRLLQEGMSLKLIGDYLGHTHPISTQRYTKIAIDQLREVALGDAEELL